MGLGLETILIFVAFALLFAGLLRGRARNWLLFIASVIAVYWLQPWLPLRHADFLLPTFTLALTVTGWRLTRAPQKRWQQEDWQALAVLAGVIFLMGMNRFLAPGWRLTPSRPPAPGLILAVLAGTGLLLAAITRLSTSTKPRWLLGGGILVILVIFIVLKTPALAAAVAAWWRARTGQNPALASPADLGWLGFSYVSFRIIHTLRDRQTGLLPDLSLQEYVAYVIFFPAFIAGPIDRAERFVRDWQALPGLRGLDPARLSEGGASILAGLFKKFVLADSLALGMALTPELAQQTHSVLGLWALLYGYAFRLYFDFAGYTDIAIGVGLLLGVRLPENFRRPYLKTNITSFWQSWHITLSDWARFYIFSPLSRSLLRRKPRPSPRLIQFLGLMSTMLVIGLWHGVGYTFIIWGAWHGLGLFIHKVWSDRTRKWQRGLAAHPWQKRAWTLFSWGLTFQFVVLGWVWFLLPGPGLAARTLLHLFGLGW